MKNFKTITLYGVLTICLILCSTSMKSQEAAILQGVVKVTEIDQNQIYGTKQIPEAIKAHIVGYYRNIDNDNGLPFVQINDDNTGIFQIHNFEEHPMEFWIMTNEKGELLIEKGKGNPNYKIALVAKYDYSGLKRKDVPFSLIPVTINIVDKKVYIFGERVKNL